MRFTLTHVIDADVDHFWKVFFDEAFNRALVQDHANMEVLEAYTAPDGKRHRKLEYTAKIELPSFVKKLVGDGRYTEIGDYDPGTGTYSAQSLPATGSDRFTNRFELRARALSGGRCERILTMDTTVTMFGVGSMIESLLERSQRTLQTKLVAFMNDWIRQHKA